MDPGRLALGGVDAVVPGHRVRQDHDLAGVRGIGQDLAPAGGRRGEDQVAVGGQRRTAEDPGPDAAALEREQARRRERRRPLGGDGRRDGLLRYRRGLHRSFLSGIAVPALKDCAAVYRIDRADRIRA
jgi:hypothetical protein